jgi:hypothetical protein
MSRFLRLVAGVVMFCSLDAGCSSKSEPAKPPEHPVELNDAPPNPELPDLRLLEERHKDRRGK